MYRRLFSLGFLMLFICNASSQSRQTDSLLAILKNAKPDTNKVNTLYQLSILLTRSNVSEDIMKNASEVLAISQKENYKWGTGISYYVISLCEYAKRNYEQALTTLTNAEGMLQECGDKKNTGRSMYMRANILFDLGDYAGSIKNCINALETWQSIGYQALSGPCSLDLALSYTHLGNYTKGVEYTYKALRISEALGDKKVMAQSLHFIGALSYGFGEYESAMKNFLAASAIYLELENQFDFAQNNNMIGQVLLDQGNYTGAYQKFYQSLKIYEEPGAPAWGAPWGYSCIGSVYEKQGDSANAAGAKAFAIKMYKDALNSYTISLQKFEAIKDPAGTAERKIFVGRIHFKLGQLSIAKKYLLDGLEMSGKFGEKQYLVSGYLYLSQIDSAEGSTGKAYEHYKLYALYRDSMFNRESSQKLSLYKVQYEVEKKEQEIKLLAAENKLKTVTAENQSQQKKIAYAGIALIIVLAALGFFNYRKNQRLKGERTKLKDRLLISQDLHDNIGSTLSSISVYSQVAKIHSEKNDKEDLNELLEKISTTSNEMVTEMNDIVWAINPRNDSMEKIIQRMESFTRPLAAARNILFRLVYEESIARLQFDMEKRKNFYLIFKEAVNNSIKYSGASTLTAHISIAANQLMLTVTDNGVGFNPEAEMSGHSISLGGNGLKNMRSRAAELNGNLTITSQPGNGAEITLFMPLS
ncbi:MAG: sensor histidine kinase [Bacteroidota bacterium]